MHIICAYLCNFYYICVHTNLSQGQKKPSPTKQATDITNKQNSDNLSLKRRFLKELKLARSCFLVVCTFGLCFLPVILMSSPLAIVLQNEEFLGRLVWMWTIPAGVLNPSLNSIIFFWSKHMLRIEAKKVLKKIRGGSSA